MELYIVENSDKWAVPEPMDTLNDTDVDLESIVDAIIERNMGAWKVLAKK
ncbi:hypothetical protein ES708_18074 [subsurface metagenome]